MSTYINKYKVESILGEGGMGKVYLATHVESGKQAAIKELHVVLTHNEQLRQRFRREAMAMAQLDHPSIVKFYELVEDNGGLYLVMEYAKGVTLEQYITQQAGAIDTKLSSGLVLKVAEAIGYAHDRKIVHRDIKPSNIIVNTELNVKLLDFGIAKIMDNTDFNLTSAGAILGSNCYMSPEQVQGETIDSRTDIYSLGILLFYALTGKPPFNSSTLSSYDVQVRIIRDTLPKARSWNPHISEQLQAVLDRATQKDKNLRQQNCREFVAELQAAVGLQDNALPNRSRILVVGREADCDIVIDNPKVSRRHAQISLDRGQYYLQDNSTNGTVVNGGRVHKQRVVIRLHDEIVLAGVAPLAWHEIEKRLPSPVKGKAQHIGHRPEAGTATDTANHQTVLKVKPHWNTGLGILCFVLPFWGWVLYAKWRHQDRTLANKGLVTGSVGLLFWLILIGALMAT